MTNKRINLAIVLFSFGFACLLGMLDHETKSFVQLLTADWGNVLALFLYTSVFATIGLVVFGRGKS